MILNVDTLLTDIRERPEQIAEGLMTVALGCAKKYYSRYRQHQDEIKSVALYSVCLAVAYLRDNDHPTPLSYIREFVNGAILTYLRTERRQKKKLQEYGNLGGRKTQRGKFYSRNEDIKYLYTQLANKPGNYSTDLEELVTSLKLDQLEDQILRLRLDGLTSSEIATKIKKRKAYVLEVLNGIADKIINT